MLGSINVSYKGVQEKTSGNTTKSKKTSWKKKETLLTSFDHYKVKIREKNKTITVTATASFAKKGKFELVKEGHDKKITAKHLNASQQEKILKIVNEELKAIKDKK